MRHLVGERQQVERRLDVADRPVHIDRLDRVATGEVDHLEHLAQLEQVAEGVASAGAAHAVEADDVGWAADGAEGDVVAADRQGVCRVPRVQLELSRARADQLDDHRRVEADALAVDRRPGGGEPLARSGVEEVHPDLGEDAQRRVVDRLPARPPRPPRSAGSAYAAGGTARCSGRRARRSAVRPRPPRRAFVVSSSSVIPGTNVPHIQAPRATVPRATTASPNPIVCGRVSRSWSSSVASTTVLAGYIEVITATSDSSPSRVASR